MSRRIYILYFLIFLCHATASDSQTKIILTPMQEETEVNTEQVDMKKIVCVISFFLASSASVLSLVSEYYFHNNPVLNFATNEASTILSLIDTTISVFLYSNKGPTGGIFTNFIMSNFTGRCGTVLRVTSTTLSNTSNSVLAMAPVIGPVATANISRITGITASITQAISAIFSFAAYRNAKQNQAPALPKHYIMEIIHDKQSPLN